MRLGIRCSLSDPKRTLPSYSVRGPRFSSRRDGLVTLCSIIVAHSLRLFDRLAKIN